MSPKVRVLIWEQCRTGGVIALACVGAGIVLLAILKVSVFLDWAPIAHHLAKGNDLILLAAMLPILMAAVLTTFSRDNQGRLVGGFPTHVLRLPVRISVAMAATLIPRIFFVLTVGFLVQAVCYSLFGDAPSLSDVIFFTQVYLFIQLLDWLRGPVSGLTSLIVLAAGIAFLALLANMGESLEAYRSLTVSLSASTLSFAALFCIVYFASLPAVIATQRGERVGIPEIWEWPKFISLATEGRAKPFRSPMSAQIWFELRRSGWHLPALTVLLYVLFRVGMWATLGEDAGFMDDLVPLVAVFIASVGCGAFRPLAGDLRRARARTIPYTYPMTTLDLAKARLWANGISFAGTLLAAGVASTMTFLFLADGFALGILREALSEGETTIREILAYLLVPVLATGILAWAAMHLSSRVMLGLFLVAIAAGAYFAYTHWLGYLNVPGVWISRLLIVLLVGGTATAYYLVWRLRLMTKRHLALCGVVWVGLALLFFPSSLAAIPRASGPLTDTHPAAALTFLAALAAGGLGILPAAAVVLDLNRRRHGGDCQEHAAQYFRSAARNRVLDRARRRTPFVLAGCAILFAAWLKWPLEPAYRAACRARGLPTTAAELDASYPDIPAEENLALKYLEVAKSVVENENDWREMRCNQDLAIMEGRPRHRVFVDYTGKHRHVFAPGEVARTWLERYYMDRLLVVGSGRLRRARPVRAEDWHYTEDYWKAVVDDAAGRMGEFASWEVGESRYPIEFSGKSLSWLGYVMAVDALKAAVDNRPGEAVDSIVATLRLSASLDREPLLSSQLTRFFILHTAARALEDTMNRVDLPEEDLNRVQRQFETALPPIEERAALDQILLRRAAMDAARMENTPCPGPFLALGWNEMRFFDRLVRIRTAFRTVEENRRLGYACQSLGEEAYVAPDEGSLWLRMPLSVFWPSRPGRSYESEWAARVKLDLASAAAGVERYRLNHGRLPDTLDHLVPEFLSVVPKDPFDQNRPIRYRIKDNGEFVVYSLSINGEDNQGEEMEQAYYEGDITFTVAPPEVRAQARTVAPPQ